MSQAASLPLREVVCPFFENEILPNTHFRRVLPGQNARNFGRENRDSLSCWHHTTVKIHLLKCLHHRNLEATIHELFQSLESAMATFRKAPPSRAYLKDVFPPLQRRPLPIPPRLSLPS